MSLRLDELRKRLLQQQLGNDAAVPESPPSVGSGKAVGFPKVLRGLEALQNGTAPEPSIRAKIVEPDVENMPSAAEATAVGTSPQPSGMEAPNAAAASSLEAEPEPAAPPVQSGQPAAKDAGHTGAVVEHELADAVGKVFEQTKALQAQLEDLNRIFEPIDRIGNSAAGAFAPLRGFQKQMSQLARSFEPMRSFQHELSQLAQDFEPMKALEGQVVQLANSFRTHIGELIKALEPAKQMRDRMEQLSARFDEAAELQDQFNELYSAFQLSPSPGASSNGLQAQEGMAG